MKLSLIICDHNDHDMVTELLRQPAQWGVPLFEALVADDASERPFSVPEGLPFPARVIRSDTCRGCAATKMYALDQSAGDVLVALDADIRPHAHWVRHALTYIAREDVGLVGAPITPRLGRGEFSRAWHKCVTVERADTTTGFVPGGCIMLRKSSFESIGGLQAYKDAGSPFEDVYLSRSMRAAGLGIVCAGRFPVYEVRELELLEFCRREARYFAPAVGAMAAKHDAARYVQDMRPRFEEAVRNMHESGTPVMLYARLLSVCAVLYAALGYGLSNISGKDVTEGAVWLIRQSNKASARFARDAAVMGLPEVESPRHIEIFNGLESLFDAESVKRLGLWA